MLFRDAKVEDWSAVWRVFSAVVSTGDTYAYPPEIDEHAARDIWMPDDPRRRVFVVVLDGAVVGTAYTRPSQPGLGDHVANAGWMIHPEAAGRGIGRRFAHHVMEAAREDGYTAMQFNSVVETNSGAIALWRSLGFEIVGTVPGAFRHATAGPVAIHIMHREL